MKNNRCKATLCFSIFIFIVLTLGTNSYAESSINIHTGAGVGLRYGFATFPLPLINVNKSINDAVAFIEVVPSAMLLAASLGYAQKISHKSSIKAAVIQSASLSGYYTGYKWSYVYNSNRFNGSGWETSLELYSLKHKSSAPDDIRPDSDGQKSYEPRSKYLFPSVSFGYIW
jgi:hypothetical protein